MTCARSTLDIDKIEFRMETSWGRPRKNRFWESEKYPRVNLHKIPFISRWIPLARRSVSSSHMEFVSDGNPGNSERCEPRNNSLIGNYCQNAHFQTSESRLDVHTHFWFFHFCRLNRELFLGHVISTRRRREPHGTVETRVRAREEQGRLRRPVASLLCEVGRPPAAARDPDTSEVASITLGIVRGAKDST